MRVVCTLVVVVTDDEDDNSSSSMPEKKQITTVAEAISNELDLKKQLLSFRHQEYDNYDLFASPIGRGAPSIADVVSVQYTSFTNPADVDESNEASEALFTAITAGGSDEMGEWGDDESTSAYGPVTRKTHDELQRWAEAQRIDVERKKEERMVDDRLKARTLENQRLQAQYEENKRREALLQQERKEEEKRRAEAAIAEVLDRQRAARERMLAEEKADDEIDGW